MAWVRSREPVLAKIRLTWVLTVASLTKSARAMRRVVFDPVAARHVQVDEDDLRSFCFDDSTAASLLRSVVMAMMPTTVGPADAVLKPRGTCGTRAARPAIAVALISVLASRDDTEDGER